MGKGILINTSNLNLLIESFFNKNKQKNLFDNNFRHLNHTTTLANIYNTWENYTIWYTIYINIYQYNII